MVSSSCGLLDRNFVAPGEQLAQPGDLLLELLRRLGLLLVLPVRGDAVLRLAVHLLGADLHFQRPAARPEHRGVQRLVQVALGARDVVVELLRDRLPQVVHHAERGVAVLHLRHDHAQRAHVVHLGEVELLGAHLVPDGIDVLRPPGDLGLDLEREAPAESIFIALARCTARARGASRPASARCACRARARGSGTTGPRAPT